MVMNSVWLILNYDSIWLGNEWFVLYVFLEFFKGNLWIENEVRKIIFVISGDFYIIFLK